MELKFVDPRALKENPDKARRSKSSPQADALLLATIKVVGIVQPPVVAPETEGGNGFVIDAGHRRVKQAIAAGLEEGILNEVRRIGLGLQSPTNVRASENHQVIAVMLQELVQSVRAAATGHVQQLGRIGGLVRHGFAKSFSNRPAAVALGAAQNRKVGPAIVVGALRVP